MATITTKELYNFHSIDRELFHLMISPLKRNLAESITVMATWLWLEQRGYPNIIVKLLNASVPMINMIANEAVSSLRCLESSHPPPTDNGGMNFTARMMRKNITLQMFYRNRFTAVTGIKNVLNSVCARIFSDIILSKLVEQGLRLDDIEINRPVNVTGFPHALFGAISIVPRTMDYAFPMGALWGWGPDSNVTEDDRTMFLTFSRGFPVKETEVTELFTSMFGDCVDTVHMQENLAPDEQPLFARLVLRSVTTVDRILTGRRIAKFQINGKHIWARKYERRD